MPLDHDECQDTGMCTNGHCINMNGSFRCKCNDGYILSPSKNTCIGEIYTFILKRDHILQVI